MALVFMEGWQLECCGERFTVGDRVEWTLQPIEGRAWYSDALGSALADELAFHEEHHGGALQGHPQTAGTVTSIRAAFCRYGSQPGEDPRNRYPIAGTGRLERIERADPTDLLARVPSDDQFVGLVIDLDT